jgi:hypothetical protein
MPLASNFTNILLLQKYYMRIQGHWYYIHLCVLYMPVWCWIVFWTTFFNGRPWNKDWDTWILASFLNFFQKTQHLIHLLSRGWCSLHHVLSQGSALVGGVCHTHGVVCGWGTLPPFTWITSRTISNLKCLCDHFETWEARIKLLSTERSRIWKNSFLSIFMAVWQWSKCSACGWICSHTPYICYSLAVYLNSELFCVHHRNYFL